MKPHLRNGAAYQNLTIGLLGGSFNPAHDGHLAMSLYALKQLRLDQIWWLMSPQNPLKDSQDMAPLERRLTYAQKFIRHPRLVICDLETALGTRHTAHTIRLLKRRFPHVRFVWLMGADNLKQIPRWKDWQNIFHLVPVAVFRRPAYAAGCGMGKAAIRFSRAWRHPGKAKNLIMDHVPAWITLDNKLNYMSATKIRKDNPTW